MIDIVAACSRINRDREISAVSLASDLSGMEWSVVPRLEFALQVKTDSVDSMFQEGQSYRIAVDPVEVAESLTVDISAECVQVYKSLPDRVHVYLWYQPQLPNPDALQMLDWHIWLKPEFEQLFAEEQNYRVVVNSV
jgi:hypothetical protein